MSRRSLSTILVVMLALWGAGLPRFAHVMTAHLPGKVSLAAQAQNTSTQRCTSNCCVLHAAPAEETAELEVESANDCSSGCNHAHHCNICELLATLLTSVPALPAASTAWQPVEECIPDAPAHVVLIGYFDPHAPRGPPDRA